MVISGYWPRPSLQDTYRKVVDDNGTVWLIPISGDIAWGVKGFPNVADGIHTDYPDDKRSLGYGGSTVEFMLVDGTTYTAKGPWHSNSMGLYERTGVNVSDLHLTQVTISLDAGEAFMQPGNDVVYAESEPVLGPFMRGERIAQQLADVLDKPLYCVSKSTGGGSARWHKPGDVLHPMARRKD